MNKNMNPSKYSATKSGLIARYCVAWLLVLTGSIAPLAHAQNANPATTNWVMVDDQIVPAYAVRPLKSNATDSNAPNSSFYPWVNRWTGGRVYYSYDDSMKPAKRAIFEAGCREWEKYANLRFNPRTNEPNYIKVVSTANVSNSYVGMVGGEQILNLADWANPFTAVHELAHALGVLHEQSRPGRDTYVTIHTENIQKELAFNFAIVDGALNQGDYDFDSVMHYHEMAFSINGKPTIVANPGYTQFQKTMGQSNHTSAGDAAGMAKIYGPPQTITIVNPAAGSIFNGKTDLAATTLYVETGATVRFDARPAPLTQTRNPNLPISRGQVSTQKDKMSVSFPGNVVTAFVSVDFDHELQGVMELSLIAPNGTRTKFRPFTGVPGTTLKQSFNVSALLSGKPIAGDYQLEVFNNSSTYGGKFNSWSLTFAQLYANVGTDTDGPDAKNRYTVKWKDLPVKPTPYEVRAVFLAGLFSTHSSIVAQYKPGNRAPVATSRSFSTVSPNSVSGTLTGTDEDEDALTFATARNPAHGSVTVKANGSFTYAPVASYVGSDSFTFIANDGEAHSPPATVSITVKQGNRAPVLSEATFNTTQFAAFSKQLVGTDADDDTLSYKITAGTLQEGLKLSEKGLIAGTPTQSGTKVVTVEVADGKGGKGSAQITVKVIEVPTAVINDVKFEVIAGQTTSVALSGTDPVGGGLRYYITQGPTGAGSTGGAYTFQSDGQWRLFYRSSADFSGTDTVKFVAIDKDGHPSNTATATITVRRPAPAPTANSVKGNAIAGQNLILNLSGTDPTGGGVTYHILEGPKGGGTTGGAYPFQRDGQWHLLYRSSGDFSGTDTVKFAAIDKNGRKSNTAIATITVSPPVALPSIQSVSADASPGQTISIALGKTDPANDVTYRITQGPTGAGTTGGAYIAQSDGQWRLYYRSSADFIGTDIVKFVALAKDGRKSNTATATIKVTQSAPTAKDVKFDAISAQLISVPLSGVDPIGGGLRYYVTQQPSGGGKASGAYAAESGGQWRLFYRSGVDFSGTDTVKFIAMDSQNRQSDPATATITVRKPASDAPVTGSGGQS